MGLLFLVLGVIAIILAIYHWDKIDAAFVSFLDGAAQSIPMQFAHAEVITTSSTTPALP